jgi:cell division protein FtsQ
VSATAGGQSGARDVTDQDPERLRRRGAFAPLGQRKPRSPGAPAARGVAQGSGTQEGSARGVAGPGGVAQAVAGPGGVAQAVAGAGGGAQAGRERKGPQRPHDPWKAMFILLALAGIVVGVAWALLGSRFFVVRSVQVTGLHRVTREQVVAAAAIPVGLPLIRINDGAVSRRVDAITQVEAARITRSWPDGIAIRITERTPALAIADGGRYDLVDRFGVVVVSASQRPPRMPLFVPSGPLRGSPAVAAAVDVLHELPARLAGRLRSITAPNPDEVTLRLTAGVTVIWGSPGGVAVKDRVLAILMRTHASYYDVSAPTVATTH